MTGISPAMHTVEEKMGGQEEEEEKGEVWRRGQLTPISA